VTKAFKRWVSDLESAAATRQVSVTRLYDADAVRTNTETELRQNRPSVFAFLGHGKRSQLLQDKRTAILDESNANLLVGTIALTIACDSADQLGAIAVQRGARAYVGYRRRFFFALSGEAEERFRLAANTPAMSLLSSADTTCQVAVNAAKRLFEEGVEFYDRGPGSGGYDADVTASWFNWDRDYLTLIGDATAKA
jgi:hypothetical protein